MSTEVRPSNRPTHRVYAVKERKSGDNTWQEIGAAWSHSDGKGFNLKLEYLPLNGAELVIRVPKERSESPDSVSQEGAAL